jgi:hypothetical protein
MFELIERRAKSVATIGVAAALVVAGVAAADSEGDSSGGSGSGRSAKAHHGTPPGPPSMMMMGAPMKDLTYSETHVRREGRDQVIRLDEGNVVSVDSSSITLAENDGNEVTIDLDGNTQVLSGPGGESSVEDLKTGEQVIVCGPEGGAAKTIVVPPKKGELPKGAPGGQLPPPPGVPMGS